MWQIKEFSSCMDTNRYLKDYSAYIIDVKNWIRTKDGGCEVLVKIKYAILDVK